MRRLALSLCLLVVILFAFPRASSQPDSSCSDRCWTQGGAPTLWLLAGYYSLSATYTNTANLALIGVIFAVVHDSAGQTVDISTATLRLASGANGTAYPIVFGLAPGSYTATMFVTSASGTAISASAVENFTLGA